MGMPALHIRDISDTLMKRLKSDAALGGVTLREYVIGRLDYVKGEVGESLKVDFLVKRASEADEKPEDHRAEDVPRHREVRAPGRRKSAAGGVSERTDLDVTSSKDAAIGKVSLPIRQVPRCEHGTEKGYHCWQCGGLAKVQKEAEA